MKANITNSNVAHNAGQTPTYAEIAADYRLWEEYVDPSALQTEEDFDAMTIEERIKFMVECFGINS